MNTKHPAMKALEDLTPGGSEYHEDIPRCVEFIRYHLNQLHETKVALVRERKRNAAASKLLEALYYVRDLLPDEGTARRVIEAAIAEAEGGQP